MSDFSQGEGWWQASDGKWYPPETAAPGYAAPTTSMPTAPPAYGAPTTSMPTAPPTAGGPTWSAPLSGPLPGPIGAPPAGPPPAKTGLGTGPIIGIAVAVVVLVGAIVFFATSGGSSKKNVAFSESSSSSSSSSSTKSTRSSTSFGSSGSAFSTSAPDVVAPPGFKVFSSDKDGFAVALPNSLEVIDLSSGDIDKLLEQLSANNPDLAKLGPQIKAIFAAGGKLFAIDTSGGAGSFTDNLNILASPGSGDVTSGASKAQVEQQLSAINATNIQFDTLTVHGRKVLSTSYEASVNGADGSTVNFFGRQAIVSISGQLWVITLSSSTDRSDDFDTIIQTFDVNG